MRGRAIAKDERSSRTIKRERPRGDDRLRKDRDSDRSARRNARKTHAAEPAPGALAPATGLPERGLSRRPRRRPSSRRRDDRTVRVRRDFWRRPRGGAHSAHARRAPHPPRRQVIGGGEIARSPWLSPPPRNHTRSSSWRRRNTRTTCSRFGAASVATPARLLHPAQRSRVRVPRAEAGGMHAGNRRVPGEHGSRGDEGGLRTRHAVPGVGGRTLHPIGVQGRGALRRRRAANRDVVHRRRREDDGVRPQTKRKSTIASRATVFPLDRSLQPRSVYTPRSETSPRTRRTLELCPSIIHRGVIRPRKYPPLSDAPSRCRRASWRTRPSRRAHAGVFPQLAVIAEDEVADRHRSPTNAARSTLS